MSIYIKGMKMPESCWDCEVGGAKQMDNATCPFYSMEYLEQENYQDKIADGCPLVPVPPQYDLIDHNALKIAVMDCDAETRIDFLKHAMDCINKAPVVIPSDMPTYEAEEGE